jgi:hypothetical protein
MVKSKSLDDDYFIKNAVLCWLHHYGNKGHRWDDIYKELASRDTYTTTKPTPRRATKTTTKRVRVQNND